MFRETQRRIAERVVEYLVAHQCQTVMLLSNLASVG